MVNVSGILLGFDPFMNLVIDDCVAITAHVQQNNTGSVVIGNSYYHHVRSLGKTINNGVFSREINYLHRYPFQRICLTMM